MEAEAERMCEGYEDLALVFVEREGKDPTEEQENEIFFNILDFITKGACRELVFGSSFKAILEEASFKFMEAVSFKRKSSKRIYENSITVAECTVRRMSDIPFSSPALLRYFVEDNPENDPEKLDRRNLIDQLNFKLKSFDDRCDALCRVSKKLGCYIVYDRHQMRLTCADYFARRVVISPSGEILSQEEVDDHETYKLTPARTVIANDAFAKYIVERDLGMFEEIMFYNGYEPKKEGAQNG